jgi:GxxExxY protein
MTVPQSHGDTEQQINKLTEQIIALAIEVHRVLGPGLLESTYIAALSFEFEAAHVAYERNVAIPAYYKGHLLGEYRLDFVVDNLVVVEVKSVERMLPVFDAQILTYLRVASKHVGLLINFNSRLVTAGVKRFVL